MWYQESDFLIPLIFRLGNFKVEMKKLRTKVTIFILILIGFSCSDQKIKYKLLYSEDEPIGKISEIMERELEEHLNIEIERINGFGSIANLDSLTMGKADLAIVENYIDYHDSIKTLLTFYPQILHIFYTGEEANSFEELIYGKKVFIGLEGSGSYRFMMNLFEYFDLDQSRFEVTESAFINDVIAGFIDIVPESSLIGFENFKIYSFDNVENFGQGSIVEGIALRYPQVHPFIIPEYTYRGLTEEPVVTIATDALLVTREGMRENAIYDITKTIFDHKQEFTNISPLIFDGLNENIDRGQLSFPLHEGARIYLDRDEPGFFERYAELFGVFFSVMIALVSGIISLSKWQSQKKKDRVDIFYKDLLDVKNAIKDITSSEQGITKIKEVQSSQNKAFEMLINEELSANESFRIYMELSKETIVDLKSRIRALKSLNR